MLADIAKAFLNIKLRRDSDKNCFSFVVYHNGKFHYFRYLTIIFGFVSSPFILSYIINYHANKYTSDSVKDILCDKFYVDNMVITSNSKTDLIKTGQKVKQTLGEVGFHLREWNSNFLDIAQMFDDSILNLSDCKLLGYVFQSNTDEIYIKNTTLNCSYTTKRDVVSTVGKIFDPLELITPYLISCRSFIRVLCQDKYSWDEKLPKPVLDQWGKVASEFNEAMRVNEVLIPRQVINSSKSISLFVFYDASKETYGFVMYSV